MLSTQFVQTKTGTATRYQQKQDFESLFLSLSGLNLTESPTVRQADNGVLANCGFPSTPHVVFGHSSFFKRNPGFKDFPSPDEVRQLALFQNVQHSAGAALVSIPELGLFVKYGPGVQISEAKTMLAMQYNLRHDVPVPEVFGWRKDGNETFIYMSLPDGVTLADAWTQLSDDQKSSICSQIRAIVRSYRRLRQNNSTRTRVEQIDGTPISSHPFNRLSTRTQTFPTVAAFHSYFVSTAMSLSASSSRVSSSCHFQPNSFFLDSTPISFTHGNIHPSNIVISNEPNPRVLALLDWSQAGWYPAYWEFCKARWAVGRGAVVEDWEGSYLGWILDDEVFGIKKWGGSTLTHYWDYFVGLYERAGQ